MYSGTINRIADSNGGGPVPWDGDVPTDTLAERRWLGSIMIAPEHPDTLRTLDTMQADQFFDDKHRQIASRILQLYRGGVPPDALTVRHDLTQLGLLASDDDLAHFAEMLQSTATAFSVIHWADLVRKAAESRDYILALQDGIARVSNGDDPATVRADVDAELDLRGAGDESVFEWYNPEQFAKADFAIEWDIEGVLVHGQPCILVGPSKGLKTTVLMDAAVSLGKGGHLLGYYKVAQPRTVAFMSCESGLATLKATLNRICRKAGVVPDQSNVHVCGDVPQLNSPKHLAAVKRHLEKIKADVFILDPLYRAMGGDVEAANLFAMGDLLGNLDAICQQTGTTLIVAHHCKQGAGKDGKSLTLDDASWAGMQQFFRQWWTLSRREQYVEGSGEHKMIFTAGGSVGHSLGVGLDVFEGTDYDNRQWDVTIRSLGELKDDSADRVFEAAEDRRDRVQQKQLEKDMRTLTDVLVSYPEGETAATVRSAAKISGNRASAALAELVASGDAVMCEITKSNRKQPYEGYRLNMGND